MFEFHQYRPQKGDPSPLGVSISPAGGAAVSHLSFMVWGEHCVECAAPACFVSCDLYEPRPDGRCRRFGLGVRKNSAFSGLRDHGAEIHFRRWGKLEARGNTRMEPLGRLLWKERWAERLARLLNAIGALLFGITRDQRLRHLAFSLLERYNRHLHRSHPHPERLPDAFVLETFNPGANSLVLNLTMSVSRASLEPAQQGAQIPPPFSVRITLDPGHNRHQFEARLFQSVSGCGLPFDVALVPEMEGGRGKEWGELVIGTADFVVFRTKPQMENIKCLVWDLDHTLWQGVLLEGAPKGVRSGVRELIETLDQRGILNSVASKNDHDQAWKMLEKMGLSDYFLAPQINWRPKSGNIKEIARQLNIGLNTFAFIDDSPFELEEVSRALPQVAVFEVGRLSELVDHPRFQGSTSSEAKERRRYYQDAFVREQVQSRFGADYRGFLASCEIVLTVQPYGSQQAGRVAELMQRTNQLNFSGAKYGRDALPGLLRDPDLQKHVLSVSDRFGSYGIVGFSLVRRVGGVLRVEEFMLSCRVQGKFIEQAFFNSLLEGEAGVEQLWVNFQPTNRNTPARQTLESLGFEIKEGEQGLFLDLQKNSLVCDFIQTNRNPQSK
ncbi:MAG: HAD-IIIC family phosphatase [Magnetococcales bacterium]|nr:HAD-IIIC family phosphatase [Magnetococcales bacterium]